MDGVTDCSTPVAGADGWLDEPWPLPAAAIDRFGEEGFVRLSGVLPADGLARYAREITRLTLALSDERRALSERSTYDRAFLQVMNLWRVDETVRRFVFGRRLARIAAELLGVRSVRLYHDQSLYKEPGGGITPAHADQYYWPLASDRTVTAWIPLQPVPVEMGPLEFYAGSQRFELHRDLAISDESERAITAAMEAQAFRRVVEPFALGDVSFHAGWTFHRAGVNSTDRPRSVMTVIYMDGDMRLAARVAPAQQNDWRQWCPGAVPGGPIATPLNPVLYP